MKIKNAKESRQKQKSDRWLLTLDLMPTLSHFVYCEQGATTRDFALSKKWPYDWLHAYL